MKRLSLILVASIFLFLMAVLTTPPLVWPHPGIEVVPSQYNFGDVELGSSSSTIITITNNWLGMLSITVSFQALSSPDFSITLAPPPGTLLMSGDSADIEVTYTPSALGAASAVLAISWVNGEIGNEYVSLDGVGVATEPPPPVTIEEILEFFDSSVEEGILFGNGPVYSAEKRLSALRNIILITASFINKGLIEVACKHLMNAYKRCDSLPPPESPPDFVSGPATSDLAVMIQNLRISLGC